MRVIRVNVHLRANSSLNRGNAGHLWRTMLHLQATLIHTYAHEQPHSSLTMGTLLNTSISPYPKFLHQTLLFHTTRIWTKPNHIQPYPAHQPRYTQPQWRHCWSPGEHHGSTVEQAHTFLSVLVIAWSKHPIFFYSDCISIPNFEVLGHSSPLWPKTLTTPHLSPK